MILTKSKHKKDSQMLLKNGAWIIEEITLCKFRRIARARSAAELQQSLNDLRNCEYWKGGYVNMVNGFGKQRLSLIEAV